MEALEAKLPHHMSKEYKVMVEKGLINDKKEYVGTVELGEYLQALKDGIEMENPIAQEVGKEATMTVSEAKAMFAEMLKSMAPAPVPQQQFQPQYQSSQRVEHDIDDIPELRDWEMKDREYELCDGTKPISCSIPSKHSKEIPLQYTNKDTKKVHILRYATNQPSFFIEKQSTEPGSVLISDIIFNYGRLKVSADNINLQKFLAIHSYKDTLFQEYDPKAKSVKAVSDKKLQLKAGGLVFSVGEMTNRAIASLVCPSYVDSWELELLEEEILAYAEKEPKKYIAYTEDPTIKMKGVIKRALAMGDLIYSNYRFLNKKRETLLEVAKNQDEMDEMVKHFESGAGRTTYEFLLNSQN
jgi:hypothetical protein